MYRSLRKPFPGPPPGVFTRYLPGASLVGIIPGAFHVDPVNGSDSNNGILVGETGSGTTLNGTAGTGPKQTIASIAADIASGNYAQGDLFYPWPGTHLVDQYRYFNGLGTSMAWSRSTFNADPYAYDPDVLEMRNLPGQSWILSTEGASPATDSSNGYGPWIIKGNFRCSGAELQVGNIMFFFGGAGTGTATSAGAHIYRCYQSQTFTNTERPYGSQKGIINGEDTLCEDLTIQECYLLGMISGGDNQATVFFDRPGGNILVTDCYIASDPNKVGAPSPMHFKYAAAARAIDDWLFQRCMIANFGTSQCIRQADGFSGATFRHCIMWMADSSGSYFCGDAGDTGGASAGPEGYQIRLYNNGMYRGDGLNSRRAIWIAQESSPDGTQWEIFRNVMHGRIDMETYPGAAAYAEDFVGDENVFDAASSITHSRGPNDLTLSQWVSYQSGQGAGNDDANSEIDSIIFADPGNQDPDDPATFELSSGMALYGTAGPDLSTWRRWATAGTGSW